MKKVLDLLGRPLIILLVIDFSFVESYFLLSLFQRFFGYGTYSFGLVDFGAIASQIAIGVFIATFILCVIYMFIGIWTLLGKLGKKKGSNAYAVKMLIRSVVGISTLAFLYFGLTYINMMLLNL